MVKRFLYWSIGNRIGADPEHRSRSQSRQETDEHPTEPGRGKLLQHFRCKLDRFGADTHLFCSGAALLCFLSLDSLGAASCSRFGCCCDLCRRCDSDSPLVDIFPIASQRFANRRHWQREHGSRKHRNTPILYGADPNDAYIQFPGNLPETKCKK